ncbi:hypothetical protein BRD13_02075 [Halobacteriales archaeon SW_5_70_135]|nr:MAG: hypothetical protein BRD13_02075 [Halobacteriales archaeon SW_5_70_135]
MGADDTRRDLLVAVGVGVCGGLAGCVGGEDDAADLPFEREVDPSRTYLRTQSDDAGDARSVDLSSLGVDPGLTVRLERLGSFTGSSSDGTGMTGVFSGSSELAADVRERVIDAVDAGEDYETAATFEGNAETDVPEDFLIADNENERTSTTVTVPEGATHLFLAAVDNFYQDNEQGDPPFTLRIESA